MTDCKICDGHDGRRAFCMPARNSNSLMRYRELAAVSESEGQSDSLFASNNMKTTMYKVNAAGGR